MRIKGEKVASVALHQLKHIYLYGAVQVTAHAVQYLLGADVSVAYFTAAGRFLGLLHGLGTSGIDARLGQLSQQAQTMGLGALGNELSALRRAITLGSRSRWFFMKSPII